MSEENIRQIFGQPNMGIVLLSEYMCAPNGASYRCIGGLIHIENTEDIGIKVGSSSDKFAAVVTGPKTRMVIPGCKIHALLQTDEMQNDAGTWVLQ